MILNIVKYAFLTFLLFLSSPVRAVTVVTPNVKKDISSFKEKDNVFVSATAFSSCFNGSCKYDITNNKFVITINKVQVSIVAQNPFWVSGNKTYQCYPEPILKNGELYIPVQKVSDVLNSISPMRFVWDDSTGILNAFSVNAVIKSIKISNKKEKTVATIHVVGSIEYTTSLKSSTLILNVSKGIISSEKPKKNDGLIGAVEFFQLKSSAQISFLIHDNTNTPKVYVDSVFNNIVIEVSKREKSSVKNVAKTKKRFNEIKTIIVDPGHGGKDPGAIGWKGVKEKDIVLQVALKLAKMLKEKTNMKVILTRDKDVFIKLRERTRIANDSKADLFLSIHCNSIAGSKRRKRNVYGFKAYIYSPAKIESDRLVAMKENSAIRFEVDDESQTGLGATEGILFDIMNNEFLRESEIWASMIIEDMSKKNKASRKLHTGMGQARFYVLKGAYMPSVLFEIGFISNKNESQHLKSQRYQNKIVKSIYSSVMRFKEKYEKE